MSQTPREVFEVLLSELIGERCVNPRDRSLPDELASERAEWLARFDAAAEWESVALTAAEKAKLCDRFVDALVDTLKVWVAAQVEQIQKTGGGTGDDVDWTSERACAVYYLREVCEEFGDNDWSDDLHLGDVIDKHLNRYLLEDDPT